MMAEENNKRPEHKFFFWAVMGSVRGSHIKRITCQLNPGTSLGMLGNSSLDIDIDELDDEQQNQRPSRRPRHAVPSDNSSRDMVSPDIIILDSDDGSEPGPSTRRRPGVSYLIRR